MCTDAKCKKTIWVLIKCRRPCKAWMKTCLKTYESEFVLFFSFSFCFSLLKMTYICFGTILEIFLGKITKRGADFTSCPGHQKPLLRHWKFQSISIIEFIYTYYKTGDMILAKSNQQIKTKIPKCNFFGWWGSWNRAFLLLFLFFFCFLFLFVCLFLLFFLRGKEMPMNFGLYCQKTDWANELA